MARRRIPGQIETAVLTKSRRRCCLCFGLNGDATEKNGQVAHLDRDPSNWALDNLAWLCLEHHNAYDSKAIQAKGHTLLEVKSYRNKLYLEMAEMDIRWGTETNPVRGSPPIGGQDDFTVKALRELPRRAMVALAARCGMRVHPLLFEIPEKNRQDNEFHFGSLEEAIRIAEAFAKGLCPPETWEPVDPVKRPAVVAKADEAYHALSKYEPAGSAAAAVFHIAFCTWVAWQADTNECLARTSNVIDAAGAADLRAVQIVGSPVSPSHTIVLAATSLDLQKLLGCRLGNCRNLGKRIDPGPNGPMGQLWPEREPDWYQDACERMKGRP